MDGKVAKVLGSLLQSDLFLKVVQNEAVIKAMMKAFTVSVEVGQLMEARITEAMTRFNVATRDGLEALRVEQELLRDSLAGRGDAVAALTARVAQLEDKLASLSLALDALKAAQDAPKPAPEPEAELDDDKPRRPRKPRSGK